MAYRMTTLQSYAYDPPAGSTLLERHASGGPGGQTIRTLLRVDSSGMPPTPVLLHTYPGTGYAIVATDARHVDHGLWDLEIVSQPTTQAGFYWTVETRAATTTETVYRDAYGALLLSYYGQETPRLHQVQAQRGGVEIVLRRLCYGAHAQSLTALAGMVNSSDLTFTNSIGGADLTIPARMALCTGVRIEIAYGGAACWAELTLHVPYGTVINNVGPWDAWVIWADENGVTPPDAVPYGYQIQPAADFYTFEALYEEYQP